MLMRLIRIFRIKIKKKKMMWVRYKKNKKVKSKVSMMKIKKNPLT